MESLKQTTKNIKFRCQRQHACFQINDNSIFLKAEQYQSLDDLFLGAEFICHICKIWILYFRCLKIFSKHSLIIFINTWEQERQKSLQISFMFCLLQFCDYIVRCNSNKLTVSKLQQALLNDQHLDHSLSPDGFVSGSPQRLSELHMLDL